MLVAGTALATARGKIALVDGLATPVTILQASQAGCAGIVFACAIVMSRPAEYEPELGEHLAVPTSTRVFTGGAVGVLGVLTLVSLTPATFVLVALLIVGATAALTGSAMNARIADTIR